MSVFCSSHSFSYFQTHMIQSSRDRKTLQSFDRFSKSIHERTLLCNETSSNTSSSISIIDSFRLFSHLTPSLILRLVRERTCLQSICLDSSNTSIVRFDLCWEFHHSSQVVLRVRERWPLDSIRVESSRTSMTRVELFVLRVRLLENRFESSRTQETQLERTKRERERERQRERHRQRDTERELRPHESICIRSARWYKSPRVWWPYYYLY